VSYRVFPDGTVLCHSVGQYLIIKRFVLFSTQYLTRSPPACMWSQSLTTLPYLHLTQFIPACTQTNLVRARLLYIRQTIAPNQLDRLKRRRDNIKWNSDSLLHITSGIFYHKKKMNLLILTVLIHLLQLVM
jgi:hypothetical protein